MGLIIQRNRKMMCLALILLVLVYLIFGQYQEVKAVVVVDDILLITAALVYAAGVSYMGSEVIRDASELAYSWTTPDIRTELLNMKNSAVNGITSVSDTVWTWFRDKIQEKYNPGSNVINETVTSTWSSFPPSPSNTLLNYPQQAIVYNSNFNCHYLITTSGQLYMNATTIYSVGGSTYIYKLTSTATQWPTSYYSSGTSQQYTEFKESNCDIYTDSTLTSIYATKTTDVGVTDYSLSYTGSTELENTVYDYKDTAGKREIGIPVSFDWLDGKTAADVQNPSIPTPTTVPTDYTAQLDGIKSNTDAIAGALSTSGSLNFEPLKVAGTLFTNTFPFGLPWDITRSFTTLAQDAVQPNFDIDVPDTNILKGFRFHVDMSIFQDLFKFIRTAELIGFDIGLILITRRLMGGAV